MTSRKNCGYNDWVVRLETALDFFGINKESFLDQAKTDLFEGSLNTQKDFLANNMVNHVPGMKVSDAKKIVQESVEFYRGKFYDFENSRSLSFEEGVLQPVKDKLGGKK